MSNSNPLKRLSFAFAWLYLGCALILALAMLVGCSDDDGRIDRFTPQPVVNGGDDDGANVDVRTWIEREYGLPNVLNDVAWDWRSMFVAVGDHGTIVTSPDGIEWTPQVAGTDANLYAVNCDGWDCMAVGNSGTVLFSDDGENWTTWYDGPGNASLRGLYHGFVPAIVAGMALDTKSACIFRQTGPDAWTEVVALPQTGRSITDLAATRGVIPAVYVATTRIEEAPNDGRVLISNDGLTWVEVVISTDPASTLSIIMAEDNFWAGGTNGRIYSSPDGVNWTEHLTPALTSNLSAIAWSGSVLIAHGSNELFGWGDQVGVSTADGGESWQVFIIGPAYESLGIAYGNGRFVSVGRTLPAPGQGAIYTTL